jgi:type IV fimbrial biogenesis protein FimT
MRPHHAARGFTLTEMMIVVTILAIMLVIGVPALGEFIAGQRVRATVSDLYELS